MFALSVTVCEMITFELLNVGYRIRIFYLETTFDDVTDVDDLDENLHMFAEVGASRFCRLFPMTFRSGTYVRRDGRAVL